MVAVDDRLYFNCGEGGPNGYGTFGVVSNGATVSILGANDLAIGSKSDVGITHHGNCIYFVTELGCSNFLGGISAYELPSATSSLLPALAMSIVGNQIHLAWPESASDCVLEHSTTPAGTWTSLCGPGATNIVLPMTNSSAFFRLRR